MYPKALNKCAKYGYPVTTTQHCVNLKKSLGTKSSAMLKTQTFEAHPEIVKQINNCSLEVDNHPLPMGPTDIT